MPPPIVYIDTSAIREGKHEQLEAAMKDLAAFVEANMPRVISYGFFLDQNRTQMTVVAVHPDSESLEFHMDTGAAEFRKFAALIDLTRIEVYGAISDGVLERLQQKARMLGTGTVAVHELYAGFVR
jgi:quinol monooxygenase YgiN